MKNVYSYAKLVLMQKKDSHMVHDDIREEYLQSRNGHLLKYIRLSQNLCIGISNQCDWLVFCQELLHRVYEQDGAKYYEHILPIDFGPK